MRSNSGRPILDYRTPTRRPAPPLDPLPMLGERRPFATRGEIALILLMAAMEVLFLMLIGSPLRG